MKYTVTTEEFATLFSCLWYRDFPLDGYHRDGGFTSDWTIHTGIVIRKVSDLLGIFTHFESGGRCDAVLRDNNNNPVVFAEWEWQSPAEVEINEISKLRDISAKERPVFCFLLTYTPENCVEKVLTNAKKEWGTNERIIIFGLITYTGSPYRTFRRLKIYMLEGGTLTLLKDQPALPWEVEGSKWEDKG